MQLSTTGYYEVRAQKRRKAAKRKERIEAAIITLATVVVWWVAIRMIVNYLEMVA